MRFGSAPTASRAWFASLLAILIAVAGLVAPITPSLAGIGRHAEETESREDESPDRVRLNEAEAALPTPTRRRAIGASDHAEPTRASPTSSARHVASSTRAEVRGHFLAEGRALRHRLQSQTC